MDNEADHAGEDEKETGAPWQRPLVDQLRRRGVRRIQRGSLADRLVREAIGTSVAPADRVAAAVMAAWAMIGGWMTRRSLSTRA